MKKIVSISMVLLILACGILWRSNKRLREEKHRLTNNQEALMGEVELYKTEAGKSAASVLKLELSYSELKDHYEDVCKTAKELGVKVKRLQAASKTASKTEVKFQTVVRDSIIYHRDTSMMIRSIQWKDPWVSLSGIIYHDKKVKMEIKSCDTLKQIVYRVPRKFLFFRWGTKAIRQEITSSNPHTHIVYSEYIELKKKRR